MNPRISFPVLNFFIALKKTNTDSHKYKQLIISKLQQLTFTLPYSIKRYLPQ